MKLAPYGKQLAERQHFGNLPLHGTICVGANAWNRARAWHSAPDGGNPAMVCPAGIEPKLLSWPVDGLYVVIDADFGPSIDQVSALALALLECGALTVTLVSFSGSHPFTQYRWAAA